MNAHCDFASFVQASVECAIVPRQAGKGKQHQMWAVLRYIHMHIGTLDMFGADAVGSYDHDWSTK